MNKSTPNRKNRLVNAFKSTSFKNASFKNISFKSISSAVFLCLALSATALAQTDSRAKLAQSYEESGDYRNAARMYQELYVAYPNSDEYFTGVVRTLEALNQYASLVPIIEEKLLKTKSVGLYALYGEMLWRTGKAQPADEAWETAIKLSPKQSATYTIVAHAQIDARLFDKAIATFKSGREEIDNDDLFSDELSELYTATGDYANGTQEILKLYQAQPAAMSVAQGRLSALMISKEAAEHVREAVSRRADNYQNNLAIQRLYAWVLREAGDSRTAFMVYRKIDDLAQSQGRELIMFADASRNDGDLDIALKAYDAVMERGKNSPFFSTALYGYARTLELKIQNNPNLGRNETEQIIKRYRSVIEEFPKTEVAAESQFRIALLVAQQLKDYDRALKEFQTVISQYPRVVFAAEAGVESGNIYLIRDELDKAEESFKTVLKNYAQGFPATADRAAYNLAELEYFRGNMDSAQTLLAQVSVRTGSDVANDALGKMVMLEQNKQSGEALKLFARGELFERQEKFDDAVESFLKVPEKSPQAEIAEKSFVKAAELRFIKGRFAEARTLLDTMLLRYPESIYTDQALMLLGDSFAAEGRKDDAIFTYTDLLTRFKNSIYLQEARDKIRRLRGDA